jgi:hypothetical protein
MPSQPRNRTRVANTEPTSSSAASSATLEQNQNEPTLGRSGTRRPKRGFGGSSEEISRKFHLSRIGNTELISVDSPNTTLDEKAGSQRRKKRRLIQSKDLSSGGLWVSIGASLDILSRAQENHQCITTTIVGKIEAQNSKLVALHR